MALSHEGLAERRRAASLRYYHRNRTKVNHYGNERRKRQRAEEREAKGFRPYQRVLFRKDAPLYKLLANLPPVRLTAEERREYYRKWGEQRRRRLGMKVRADYLAEIRSGHPRTGSAPLRADREELEAAEHRLSVKLQEARAAVTGELAVLVREQERDDRLNGRYAQQSYGPLSLDARVFDDGDQWAVIPTALVEPDFADGLIEQMSRAA